ncbi:MAG: hypothetical protein HC889_16925 [Synechococcaceae cyanobacterium SM1_2_3]|nr:hypothetical protein [Synechococcaceae cyanobacterium SM1_2_3]
MKYDPILASDLVIRDLTLKLSKLEARLSRLESRTHMPGPKSRRAQPDRGAADAIYFAEMTPICKDIAARYGMTMADIRGRNSAKICREARKAAMLALMCSGFSSPVIGRFFDGRDHTTVLQLTRAK